MTLTAKQLKERQNYIGGSDIGSIMGFNKFNSAIDVFNKKRGEAGQSETTVQQEWGNDLEPVIKNKFDSLLQHYTALYIRSPGDTIRHKKYYFLAGNIDGLICVKGDSLDRRAILEIKTVTSMYARKFWGEENHDLDWLKHRIGVDKSNGLTANYGEVPDSYYCQCAWYMMIYDLPVTYLAVSFGGDMPFKVYKIERDLEFEEYMLETAIDFWENNVLKGIPPAPQTYGDVIKIYPHGVPKKSIIATNEICEKSHKLKDLKLQIKNAKSYEEEIKLDLKFFMKDAEILLDIAGNKLNKWSRLKVNRFQKKDFDKKEPEMSKKYTITKDEERFY